MDERDAQIEREVDADVDLNSSVSDVDLDATTSDVGLDSGSRAGTEPGTTSRTESEPGVLERYLGFSTSGFLIAVILTAIGLFLGGSIPLVGILGNFLGIAAGTFIFGAVSETSAYLESALAGALTGGGAVLLSYLFLALMGTGSLMLAIGLVVGGIAGLGGHYFGRDLRDGLTRDLGDGPPA